jgi:hypothetical protein
VRSQEPDERRVKAAELANRIRTDKPFAQQVLKDPVGALRAAGVDDQMINDFLREEDLLDEDEDDVSGFLFDGVIAGAAGAGNHKTSPSCVCTACCFTKASCSQVVVHNV